MSHHYSGPDYGFPHGDARLDLTDQRAPVSTAGEAHVTAAGDYCFFAGWRSDPFFFDTMGALNNLQFTGDDFFAGKDVCGIVLAVPNSALGFGKMGLWQRTVDGARGKWVQADRGALASQSVFLPGDEKAAYQAGQPTDDARFIHVFAHSLEHTGGYTPDQAKRAAGILLPDILLFDLSKPACYPANGRTLTDDAIDVFLSILTNEKVTRDNVGPHTDLLTFFPYVGSPHKIRSAERAAA
jgi:Domain of unknown function (DUF4331)